MRLFKLNSFNFNSFDAVNCKLRLVAQLPSMLELIGNISFCSKQIFYYGRYGGTLSRYHGLFIINNFSIFSTFLNINHDSTD
jgi:hypothetical protein